MNQIVVNTDSMNMAYKTCISEVEALRSALKEMQTSVEALNETWEGGNHTEFDATFKTRYAGIEALIESIDAYLGTFESASKSYESCNAEVLGLASF